MLDLIRQRAQSWGVKVIFGIIIIVFVAWGVDNYQQSGPGSVAVVNGKPILMTEYQQEYQTLEKRYREMLPDISAEDMKALNLPQQAISLLVNRSLVEQEAKHLGITFSAREYADMVRKDPLFRGPDGKFNQNAYTQFASSQGRPIGVYEQDVMREMLMLKMQDYITAAASVTPEDVRRRGNFDMEKRIISYIQFPIESYRENVTIAEDAVQTYYDANQARFAEPEKIEISYINVVPATLAASMNIPDEDIEAAFAKGPLRYNLREVLLPVPEGTDQAAEDALKAKLEVFAADIRNGKDFNELLLALMADHPDIQGGDSGMMDIRRIPEELLGSIAGLKKGDVAKVVKMNRMLVLTQILDSYPDLSLPESEIKASIRRSLAEDKAALTFRDVQAHTEDMVAMGKSLADIATEMKIDVRSSGLVPRQNLVSILELRKPAQISLFSGAPGSLVNALLETRDGFAVAQINEVKPAATQTLLEASAGIREILILQEAARKAEDAARTALNNITQGNPDTYKDLIITSPPFSRQSVISGLGLVRDLAEAVFTSPLDEWIKTPFATSRSAIIAMPVEIVPLSDEEWAQYESRYMDFIIQTKQRQLMNAFLAGLHDKAKITVPDPRIFEQQ